MADFTVAHPYGPTPGQMHALLTSKDYLEAKFAATGFTDVAVPVATPERVELTRTTEPQLPAFAKVLAGKQRITEVQTWTGGTTPRGEFDLRTAGTPVTIRGAITLEPDGAGTMLRVRGTAQVKVPLIGGKIADLLAGEARKNLDAEYAFTQQWIAEH